MSINYRKQERNVNFNGTTKKMYDAKIVYQGVKELKDIEQSICHACSLTEADVSAAIKALQYVIMEEISNGYIVDLGDLGRFKASFTSKAVDSADKVSKKDIKNLTCIYKPGSQMKKELQNVDIILNQDYDLKGNIVVRKHTKK